MQTLTKVGHFECDGNAVNLEIGFVPDFALFIFNEGTNPDLLFYWRDQINQATAEYGFDLIGDGNVAPITTEAQGIVAYDTELYAPTITDYDTTATPTAKTATARGTFVRPTTTNGASRELVFECVSSSGAGTTEPTWPTGAAGQQITDGGSNVWELVDDVGVARRVGGAKGVTIGASVDQNSDGNECWYIAFRVMKQQDHGDAADVAAGQVV